MGQTDNLLELFRQNGNVLKRRQITAAWPFIGVSPTRRMSDLKERGFTITYEENTKVPGDSEFFLVEPEGEQRRFA